MRAKYQEALDAGFVPPSNPPDWLDIGKDMIQQKLCCKKKSAFPDSYMPQEVIIEPELIPVEEAVVQDEGKASCFSLFDLPPSI